MSTVVFPRPDQASRGDTVAPPARPSTPAQPTTPARPTTPAPITTARTHAATHARTTSPVATWAWFAARIGMGFIFLWAFLDKLFGLGFATPAARGWLDGGSPTKGFLSGAEGPFAGFYHNLAGTTFANITFMAGLLGIGLALLTGIGMRIAAASGALLLTMMYTVALPPTTNPVIDDHLILAVLLIGIAAAGAGSTLGLGTWWANTPLVKRLPWLK